MKLRKTDSQIIVGAPCFSIVNKPACPQPKLTIFECGVKQRFDLNNNFWLDQFLTARVNVARTRVVYRIHLRAFGTCVVNQHYQIFKKVLGEWTICKAEKLVIKFGGKGKRKGKSGKVVKSCFFKRNLASVCLTQKNLNCKAWFLLCRSMQFQCLFCLFFPLSLFSFYFA